MTDTDQRPAAPQIVPGADAFALAAADVLQDLADNLPAAPAERVALLEAALDSLTRAHRAPLDIERTRLRKAEDDVHALLTRVRIVELTSQHTQSIATVYLQQNARLHAANTHYAQHLAQVRALIDATPDGGSVPVADLRGAAMFGMYEQPPMPPFVAGIATADTYRMGRFEHADGGQTRYLFIGWAVVLHPSSNGTPASITEPVFLVDGRTLPESALAQAGWHLSALLT